MYKCDSSLSPLHIVNIYHDISVHMCLVVPVLKATCKTARSVAGAVITAVTMKMLVSRAQVRSLFDNHLIVTVDYKIMLLCKNNSSFSLVLKLTLHMFCVKWSWCSDQINI